MKIENPNQIALILAASVTGVGTIILLVFAWMKVLSFPLWFIFAFVGLTFSTSFASIWFSVEKFLHGKIRVLYRAIQSPEPIKKKLKQAVRAVDMLDEVQQDVEIYVKPDDSPAPEDNGGTQNDLLVPNNKLKQKSVSIM